ncbi:hypothetical protein HN873_029654 [Arachis hypogaea]
MMDPTLMDISALNDLPVDGEFVSWSTDRPKDDFDIKFDANSRASFIENNMGSDKDLVTDSEHVAFLLLWLNSFIFCSKSVQIQKNNYLPLTIMLHHKKFIDLPALILSQLFETLSLIVDEIRRRDPSINPFGPLWVVNLWLKDILEPRLITSGSEIPYTPIDGICLFQFSWMKQKLCPQLVLFDTLSEPYSILRRTIISHIFQTHSHYDPTMFHV